jgi:hypothetical protein
MFFGRWEIGGECRTSVYDDVRPNLNLVIMTNTHPGHLTLKESMKHMFV